MNEIKKNKEILLLKNISHIYNQDFQKVNVLNNVNIRILSGEMVSLIGPSGTGKSTLLNLLSNNLTPNQGSVAIPNGLILGYLTQDLDFEDGRTVIEEAQTAFSYLNDIKDRLVIVNKEINERTDYETDSYLELISEFPKLILANKFKLSTE